MSLLFDVAVTSPPTYTRMKDKISVLTSLLNKKAKIYDVLQSHSRKSSEESDYANNNKGLMGLRNLGNTVSVKDLFYISSS